MDDLHKSLVYIDEDLKTSTTELVYQVAPQMVCDQKQKVIVKIWSCGGTTNTVWRCGKPGTEVLGTERIDC